MTLTLLKYKAECPPVGFSEYTQLCCTYHLSGNKNKSIVMEHCPRITVSFDGWWLSGRGFTLACRELPGTMTIFHSGYLFQRSSPE